jgi:hypothetical protein
MALLLLPSAGQGQATPNLRAGAYAVPVYTFADPVPRGRSLGEIRVVQPALMAHVGAFDSRLRLVATVNLEGLTIPDGELTPGDWGEGFIDRRHPHTYLHELMLSWYQRVGLGGVSLSLGKGFAPFGTDDPMARPPLRYPVNHHLSQILERSVAILGGRFGPVLLEGSLFNGDEPERPGQWPRISRFGDSWSARLTVLPIAGLEVQGSHAAVESPEHRPGFGIDQKKWSLSARWSGPVRHVPVYGLLEWARTSEAEGFFVFHSLLAEGAWRLGSNRLHYRYERTERPEEHRMLNLFRSVRPHLENAILGTTRWTIHTAGYGYQLALTRPLAAFPFVEVSYGRVADVGAGLFDARSFYGKSTFWSVSTGIRLSAGMPLHRMGRYAVAQDTAVLGERAHHGHHD